MIGLGAMSLMLSLRVTTCVLAEEPPEEAEPPDPCVEIERVAVMVESIDTECAMCPAGALMKKADHTVVDSPTYGGLSLGKATSTASYVFMHVPKSVSVLSDAL